MQYIKNKSRKIISRQTPNLENHKIKKYYMIFISQKYFSRNFISISKKNLSQGNFNQDVESKTRKNNKKNQWKIIIPSIGLDTKITEGTDSSVIDKSVGHFLATSKWNGNVGLAAHNSGRKSNYFERLKELSNNDLIYYETDMGTRKYRVILNEIIDETDWSFLRETNDNTITLITCVKNMPEYRRCVQAIEEK